MTTHPDDLRDASRAAARLSKQLELALVDVELTLPQYRALAFLERGTVAPSALAGQLAVSRPTITALIDGLVGRGLVERRNDPNDGRRTAHTLTSAGAEALADGDEAVSRRIDRLLSHLARQDRPAAIAGLRCWNAAVDAEMTRP